MNVFLRASITPDASKLFTGPERGSLWYSVVRLALYRLCKLSLLRVAGILPGNQCRVSMLG